MMVVMLSVVLVIALSEATLFNALYLLVLIIACFTQKKCEGA